MKSRRSFKLMDREKKTTAVMFIFSSSSLEKQKWKRFSLFLSSDVVLRRLVHSIDSVHFPMSADKRCLFKFSFLLIKFHENIIKQKARGLAQELNTAILNRNSRSPSDEEHRQILDFYQPQWFDHDDQEKMYYLNHRTKKKWNFIRHFSFFYLGNDCSNNNRNRSFSIRYTEFLTIALFDREVRE